MPPAMETSIWNASYVVLVSVVRLLMMPFVMVTSFMSYLGRGWFATALPG